MRENDELIAHVYRLWHAYYRDSARATTATTYQLGITREDVIDAVERIEKP